MSVTVRSMIIAAILIIAAGLLYRFSGVTGRLSDDEISSRFPTFEATQFTGEMYDETGQITHSMFSREVTYYKSRDLVDVTGVVGLFYDHEDVDQPFRGWQMSADKGELIINKHATLQGNIKVVPNFLGSMIKEITTPYVYYDIENNLVSSPQEIVLKGDNFINQGSNYVIDIKAKTFVIKDNPHAVYYPDGV